MFTKILRKLVGGESTFAPNGISSLESDPASEHGATAQLPVLPSHAVDSVIFGRDPVMDGSQKVCGYELCLRLKRETTEAAKTAESSEPGLDRQKLAEQALLEVLAQENSDTLLARRLSFISLLPDSLFSDQIEQLPARLMILILHHTHVCERPASELQDRVRALAALGFRFAWKVENGQDLAAALLSMMDFIAVDVNTPGFEQTTLRIAALPGRSANLRFIAQNVSDDETFQASRRILEQFPGPHWFQGNFITSPQPWRTDPIDVGKTRVIELLNAIQQQKENDVLVEGLRRDPLLLSRLLRFVNTAAATRSGKVASAEQALMIIGRERLYCWLSVLLFCSGVLGERDLAVMNAALIRARFAELLGAKHYDKKACEHLFLVGMFSLLDILFRMRMREALRPLELPRVVLEALLGREGPYAHIIDLVIACETRDQDRLTICAERCQLDDEFINQCHLQALLWSQEVSQD